MQISSFTPYESFPGLSTHRVALLSRLMVTAEQRNGHGLDSLVVAALQTCSQAGVDVVLFQCSPVLVRHYIRRGARAYASSPIEGSDSIMIPMVVWTRDFRRVSERGCLGSLLAIVHLREGHAFARFSQRARCRLP